MLANLKRCRDNYAQVVETARTSFDLLTAVLEGDSMDEKNMAILDAKECLHTIALSVADQCMLGVCSSMLLFPYQQCPRKSDLFCGEIAWDFVSRYFCVTMESSPY